MGRGQSVSTKYLERKGMTGPTEPPFRCRLSVSYSTLELHLVSRADRSSLELHLVSRADREDNWTAREFSLSNSMRRYKRHPSKILRSFDRWPHWLGNFSEEHSASDPLCAKISTSNLLARLPTLKCRKDTWTVEYSLSRGADV